MTISPKKKISKTRSHRRHATWQRLNLKRLANNYSIVKCKNCGSTKLAHYVCSVCGYYKGKQVITIKSKSKDKVVEA